MSLPFLSKRYGAYEQWFLAYAPGHPYLKTMMDTMVAAIRSRVRIDDSMKNVVLRLTGPDAYSAAIHIAVVQWGQRHREVDHHSWLRYSANLKKTHLEYARLRRPHYRDEGVLTSPYTDHPSGGNQTEAAAGVIEVLGTRGAPLSLGNREFSELDR